MNVRMRLFSFACELAIAVVILVTPSVSKAAPTGAVAGPWITGSGGEHRVDATQDPASLNIFRNIVRSRVLESFEALSRRDPSVALSLMAEDVRYTFEGEHALGGTRVSRAGVQRWFTRLLALVPGRFTIRSVEVSGWPWRATAYVVFEDFVEPAFGAPYRNQGIQVVELVWGKAVAIHTYVDTAKVIAALKVLAEHGVADAQASPITD